jgi:Mg-chelatase subunit ChlD
MRRDALTVLRKKKILFGGLLLLALIILPVTLYFFQQQQTTSSHAEKTVDLTFEPGFSQTDNSLHIPAGSTFTLDVYLDPGANAVSFVKLEMDYDPTKFEPAGGFIPDQNIFSQIVEGPVDQPGKITATLSVGSDLSKAIKTRTKIGTLALKALDNAPANATSMISFGSSTQALSVSSNSSYNENVVANSTPVTVQINKAQTSCGTSPGDTMLVMDTSESMNDKNGSSGTKLSNAITAANNYVDIVAGETDNRVGLVHFATTATLDSALTTSFNSVKSSISSLTANGDTCIQCGIDQANQEISAQKRTNIKNAVILLTDGIANRIEGNNRQVSAATAEQAALTAAENGHSANGTVYYTIGLGQDVDSDFLNKLATATGGQYYYSPTTDQLNAIYNQISQTLLGGSVTGTVFNDVNGNGVFEPSEPGLPGVLLWLYPLNSSTPQAVISTSSDGTYNLQNLCNGTYTIKQQVPTTWKQTLPADIRGYTFNMINGKAVTDENFGDVKLPRCSDGIDNDGNGFADEKDSTCHTDGNPNNPGSYDPNRDGEHGNSTCSDSKDNNGNGLVDGQDPVCHVDGNANNPSSYDPSRDEGSEPTPTSIPTIVPTATPIPVPSATPVPTASPTPNGSPTPTPSGTQFSLNVLLHGIGDSGDNANPTDYSLSNKTPVDPTRNASVQLFDIHNNPIATASGQIHYSSPSGSFTGIVYTQNPITAGQYTVKVWSDYHLIRLIPQILTLSPDQVNQIPQVALVAGDVNNDNQLNILDYNLILDCYSDLMPASNCDATKKVMTDLNDDGNVNQFDYNLFLREISTQPGD